MQLSYQKTKPSEHVADLGTRMIAFCLDFLLILTLIGVIEYYTISSNEEAFLLKSERLLHFLMGWLYFAGSESSAWQATLGKHLLGLRVASTRGERISFKRATIRYFARPISIFVFIMRALASSPLTSLQLLHDRVARTKVVISDRQA
ncbi:RDD domain-containing protein [Pontibacter sp. HJ8]